MATQEQLEAKAKELALFHGGKIAVVNHEGACTNAYLTLIAERQWRWGRGLHTGDLLATYIELHWRDFIQQAEEELSITSPSSTAPQ